MCKRLLILYLSLPLHSSPLYIHECYPTDCIGGVVGGWAIIKLDSALQELITLHLPRWQCNKLQKVAKRRPFH